MGKLIYVSSIHMEGYSSCPVLWQVTKPSNAGGEGIKGKHLPVSSGSSLEDAMLCTVTFLSLPIGQ